ncbi:hypothetical protein CI102_14090 [Trichoderma harzianum]|nr:hypothetical protein CI102_14090 [Trichoderma harzianum]
MTATKLAGLSTLVFVAELRTLIITNFLGVTMAPIRARSSRPWFGANSAAICSGLAANDVVIDNVDKNCSVMLEFTSGYVIAQQPDVNELRGELLGRDYETYVRMAVLSHYGLTEYDMSNGWHA